jgi:hypothetical protein
MAVVAIAATLLASGITVKRLIQLHEVYRQRAKHHAREEDNARLVLSYMAQMIDAYKPAEVAIHDAEVNADELMNDPETEKRREELMKTDPEFRRALYDIFQQATHLHKLMFPLEEVARAARSEIDQHTRLKKKYERAAALPWISVPPDAGPATVDLWPMAFKAIETSESIGAEMDSIPLPPRLEIIDPGPRKQK